MAKRSAYQQRVIKNYYENKDSIMLQRLGELVTDLYLAEGKARERIWSRVESTLQNLGISKERIDHLRGADNPSLLANLLGELLEKG
ncbi:MAG: hypothetical protein PHO07_15060 [Pirellulales bacterium]|jgi:hypothetical protein|nr:hypothetical protein [Thermoguttaceae bacterium]MDD4788493.1 hypothetical protein [Pirellulales bacterium]MDI9445742.1 hypothetical protein [Planctomycetota bacterium]NLZ01402.1 hypothetical protein [Pirellulaceae bacterium]